MRWPPRSTTVAKQQAKLAALQAATDDEDACDSPDDIDGETALRMLRKPEEEQDATGA